MCFYVKMANYDLLLAKSVSLVVLVLVGVGVASVSLETITV